MKLTERLSNIDFKDYELFKLEKRRLYNISQSEEIDFNTLQSLYSDLYRSFDYDNFIHIYNAFRQRVRRIQRRVIYMLNVAQVYNFNVLFLTFTFDEKSINLSLRYRKDYIVNFLKNNSLSFVCNLDYGKKNGREHFHALALCPTKIDYTSYIFGGLKGIKYHHTKNALKISKYINKLSYHTLKKTTQLEKVIFSRNDCSRIDKYLIRNNLPLFKFDFFDKILLTSKNF